LTSKTVPQFSDVVNYLEGLSHSESKSGPLVWAQTPGAIY